jgi:hypothetical protein
MFEKLNPLTIQCYTITYNLIQHMALLSKLLTHKVEFKMEKEFVKITNFSFISIIIKTVSKHQFIS